MNWLLSIIALIGIQGSQGRPAPADVPRDHWAFKDVDELFRAGLLDGYPAQGVQPLVLDKKVKQDLEGARKTLRRLKSEGLLVGYPEGYSSRRPLSQYEYAVAAHAAYSNIRGASGTGAHDLTAIAEIPSVVWLFSMFEPELTKLGADVPTAIRELNAIWLKQGVRFRG